MTVLDIINEACGLYGRSDANTQGIARKAVAHWARQYLLRYAWRDMQILVYTTANGQVLFLPPTIEAVQGVKINDVFQVPADANWFLEIDPTIYERAGTPVGYVPMTKSAVYASPSGSLIAVSCANPADYGKQVVIRGDLGAVDVTDTITLAAGPVVTTNQYDNVYGFTKPVTVGNVSAATSPGAVGLLTLLPSENYRVHNRLLMLEALDSTQPAKTVLVLGKRTFPDSWADGDSVPVRSLNNALIYHAWATLLESDERAGARGAAKRQEAIMLGGDALALERDQTAQTTHMRPDNDLCGAGSGIYF